MSEISRQPDNNGQLASTEFRVWQPELPYPYDVFTDLGVAEDQYELPFAVGTFPDDPEPIGSLIFPTMDMLDIHAAEVELETARTEHMALTKAGIAGEAVSTEQLADASKRLSDAQKWYNRTHP